MAMKANYGQQRAERDRQKRAKNEQKLREKAEAVAARKAALDGGAPAGDSDAPVDGEE